MSTYGWILLASVVGPVLLSFDRKVAFYRQWPAVLVAAAVVAIPFLVWDSAAAARGDWGFASEHTGLIRLLGLPLEEWLFFLVVPFACVFVYACLKAYGRPVAFRLRRWPWFAAALGCGLLALAAWPRSYSSMVLAFGAVFFVLGGTWWARTVHTRSFWLALALSAIPFLVVNGLLTALPVVSYAPSAISGLRITSIPIEDFLYGLELIGATICLSEVLRERWAPQKTPAKRVAVIGAGLSGLAVAARLAHAGYQVAVFEASANPGGKAGSLSLDGYRFDTGPSLVTLIDVYASLFRDCGQNLDDYLEFVPLPTISTYFWPDGTTFESVSAEAMPQALHKTFGENPTTAQAYFQRAARIWEAAAPAFLERTPRHLATYRHPQVWQGFRRFGALAPFSTLHGLHQRYFSDRRVVQLFDRLATYNGSDPYQSPATFAVIAHAEYGRGAYGLRGGVRALPAAIAALATKLGATMRYDEPVTKVVAEQGRVTGVTTGRGFFPADLVVSAIDQTTFYERLADPQTIPRAVGREREPSSSGIVFYWGMRGPTPGLGVNNVFFGSDYAQEFTALFTDFRCPDDPTVYVNITSKIDATDAPANGENWFVLVNAPRNNGQDWKAEVQRVRAKVVEKISAALGEPIGGRIVVEAIRTPIDIERETGSRYGSLYGDSSNSPLAAFRRHPNQHPLVRGLYFCGGSVHPGGGMPLVTLSAKIVADLIGPPKGRANRSAAS